MKFVVTLPLVIGLLPAIESYSARGTRGAQHSTLGRAAPRHADFAAAIPVVHTLHVTGTVAGATGARLLLGVRTVGNLEEDFLIGPVDTVPMANARDDCLAGRGEVALVEEKLLAAARATIASRKLTVFAGRVTCCCPLVVCARPLGVAVGQVRLDLAGLHFKRLRTPVADDDSSPVLGTSRGWEGQCRGYGG